MKNGEFIIDGVHSSEIKSLIQYRPQIQVPKRKVQIKSVQGTDGDYILDEEAYENTSVELVLFAKGSSREEEYELSDKIAHTFMGGKYLDFIPYFDSGWIYKARVEESPKINRSGEFEGILTYEVTLSMKPYKERSLETIEHSGTSQTTIKNPTRWGVPPKITLYGTGDMDLMVNGKKYVFKTVDTNIIVDSIIESAYRELSTGPDSRSNRMYTDDFPIFKPGDNKVSVTDKGERLKVEVGWRALVS